MSAALDHHLQQLLAQENSFLSRQMAALLVLQKEADTRPVLEDAFARSYQVRRDLESAMIDFQSELQRIARNASVPPHLRLLQLCRRPRPSERAKAQQAEQNRQIALFFEERTAHVPNDEALTVDLARLFCILEALEDPPKAEPSRWVQMAKYVGASVAGAVAASVATWLWKVRQQAKAQAQAKAQEIGIPERKKLPEATA